MFSRIQNSESRIQKIVETDRCFCGMGSACMEAAPIVHSTSMGVDALTARASVQGGKETPPEGTNKGRVRVLRPAARAVVPVMGTSHVNP